VGNARRAELRLAGIYLLSLSLSFVLRERIFGKECVAQFFCEEVFPKERKQSRGQVFKIIIQKFNAREKFKKEGAHKSNSQDIHFRARISNTRDDLLERRYEASIRPKNTRSRARISNTRVDRFRRL